MLGIFLVVSPWLALGGTAAIATNAVVSGAIIVTAAGFAVSRASRWAERTNFYVALWLLIAPWALGFSSYKGAMWTSVIVGLVVVCFSWFQLSILKRSPKA